MTWNKAALAAFGPPLTVILLTLDVRYGWNFGKEFWAAVLMVGMGLITFVVPNAEPKPANPNLKAVAWLALLLTAIVMLSGCSMVPYYSQVKAVADTGISTSIQDRREFNDKKLAVNLAALCDSSIGSVNRLVDDRVRDFINSMCGGDPGLTADQLQAIARLFATDNPQPLVLPAPPEEVPTEP